MWNPFAFVGKLFGSEKALDSIVKGVSKGIDNLSYTEQEKAGDAIRSRTEARSMIIEWMKTNTGSRLARRVIALTVTSIWALEHVLTSGMAVASVWVDNPDKLLKSAEILASYSQEANGAFILVIGYYFAAPYMGTMVEGAMKKLSGGLPSKVPEVEAKK